MSASKTKKGVLSLNSTPSPMFTELGELSGVAPEIVLNRLSVSWVRCWTRGPVQCESYNSEKRIKRQRVQCCRTFNPQRFINERANELFTGIRCCEYVFFERFETDTHMFRPHEIKLLQVETTCELTNSQVLCSRNVNYDTMRRCNFRLQLHAAITPDPAGAAVEVFEKLRKLVCTRTACVNLLGKIDPINLGKKILTFLQYRGQKVRNLLTHFAHIHLKRENNARMIRSFEGEYSC